MLGWKGLVNGPGIPGAPIPDHTVVDPWMVPGCLTWKGLKGKWFVFHPKSQQLVVEETAVEAAGCMETTLRNQGLLPPHAPEPSLEIGRPTPSPAWAGRHS
jgi:hypothetical protein